MSVSRVLIVIACSSLLTIAGCAGGSGFYSGGAVYMETGAYGYAGWRGDLGPPYFYGPPLYSGWASPGPFFGPSIHPRAFYPGYRHYPRAFGYGPRWGGPRHFRR